MCIRDSSKRGTFSQRHSAIVDQETCKRILKNGCEVADFLSENNSNAALRISDDLLHIGATGTNVADVQILIIS